MKTQANQAVAVITCGGEAPASLKSLCVKNGWLCVVADEAVAALRAIRVHRIVVIIVQVAADDDSSLAVLDFLSGHAGETSIIAVALQHDHALERNARAAGAHWYVPSTAATTTIEDMVASILDQRCETMLAQPRSFRVRQIERVTFPPPDRTGRRVLSPRRPTTFEGCG